MEKKEKRRQSLLASVVSKNISALMVLLLAGFFYTFDLQESLRKVQLLPTWMHLLKCL